MKFVLSTLLFVFCSFSYGQTEIYNEDFQNGLPASYTIIDNDGFIPHSSVSQFTAAWIEMVEPDTLISTGDTIVASTSYFSPAGQADRWIITDSITLGSFGNIAYWESRSYDPSFPESYAVLVSTTDTQMASFTDTLDFVYYEFEEWTQHSANLSELGVDNQTIYLAFVNRTVDGFQLFLDDIRVEMEDPVGLEEINNEVLTVYPNPSSSVIHINDNQVDNNYIVFNLDGTLLIESTATTIDISSLSSGTYILQSNSNQNTRRVRFSKI